MLIKEVTEPYKPSFNDPALMTLEEYLKHRNPEGKIHPETAYDWSLDDFINKFSPTAEKYDRLKLHNMDEREIHVYYSQLSDVLYAYSADKNLLFFILDNTLYYDPMSISYKKINEVVIRVGYNMSKIEMKREKYLEEKKQSLLKSIVVKKANNRYPDRIKTINKNGKKFTIKKNSSEDIGLFNEEGILIGQVLDEMGATLVVIAREYRGYGLGMIITDMFNKINNNLSGGFTPSGKRQAIKIWQKNVHDYLKKGWYSWLITQGQLSKDRVENILEDYEGDIDKKQFDITPPKNNKDEQYLLYSDNQRVFLLYDKNYYNEQNENYIYAYGFLNSYNKDIVIFKFEYDNEKYGKILLYTILQFARNNGFNISIDNPSDYIDLLPLEDVVEDGGYIYLEKDKINLHHLIKNEEKIRSYYDKYSEILSDLIEKAEKKFN